MPCSLCRESGHNKTTCRKKYSTQSFIKPKLPERDVQDREKIEKSQERDGSSQSKCSTLEYREKKSSNKKPYVGQLSSQIVSVEKSCKSDTNRKSDVANVDENRNVISIKSIDSISPSNNKSEHKKISNRSGIRSTLNQHVTARGSPKKPAPNNWKDIKIEDGDKDILCDLGMVRFLEGPSVDEGDGYIYMYTFDSCVRAEQRSTFKIGMTKNLPERRIQVLANENHEKYMKVHSEKVAWRRLAENLIHKQLIANGYYSPRKDVKGGTEWFKGKKDDILNVIHLVIRFLNAYALPLQR